ncbi:double zinc ribbon domain-containing protein [Adlercreutzia sp. R25]|uniref:Double zinc ribbon domain-containing protein n=1 Tax=Adlercreutzia shanghongiae TaxID=3111773 RepID=A0ABU6IXG4_9ACTN|nr:MULTISPECIES: double zinc ribbon domain-containing protein [unclassified Adlercreutzia]MEC4272557.1 double zinc ribbon domain-containing protein [Adlercreutzia sp. R25]MEC4294542.1 double zinc ribbon domain-containing protein [Adlercreutzia sp. R22]
MRLFEEEADRKRGRWLAVRDFAKEMVAETLYPTRCAVCDAPGSSLCARCAATLPFIDALLACPRCGAPFGAVQCSECTPVLLSSFGYDEPPYDEAVSALLLSDEVRRIVTVYKDQNERSLARPMAEIIARYLPPRWLARSPAITYVPATVAARRRRGFDHGERIAREVSFTVEAELAPLLVPPRRLDQRKLGRVGRIGNMRASLTVLSGASIPETLILVDDVCTTGATLFAATDALKAAGAKTVFCATFARA